MAKELEFFHQLAGNEEPPEYDEFDEIEEDEYKEPEYKVTEPHKYYSAYED